jgi:hypothetical protein
MTTSFPPGSWRAPGDAGAACGRVGAAFCGVRPGRAPSHRALDALSGRFLHITTDLEAALAVEDSDAGTLRLVPWPG